MTTSYGESVPGCAGAMVLAAFLSLAAIGGAALLHARASVARDAEPPATAAFLRAYGSADMATAERVASPLYVDAWARHGFTTGGLASLVSRVHGDANDHSPWITFAFIGGAADASGFLHLLYSASVDCTGRCEGPELWRVDTDHDGRVIWAQMVWTFDPGVRSLVTSNEVNDVPWELLPKETTVGDPRLVLAVRSATSLEGYYAMAVRAPIRATTFFAVGSDGGVRAGSWDFEFSLPADEKRDTSDPAGERNGASAAQQVRPLGRDDEALRRRYVESLS